MNSASNPLAEQSVLSMMIREDHVRRHVFGEGIQTDHFTEDRGAIFDAIRELVRGNKPIDASTVWGEVFRSGNYARDKTNADYIAYLVTVGPESQNLTAWITALREAKTVRIGHDAAAWLQGVTDANSATFTAKTALEAMKEALRGPTKSKTAKECAANFMAHIEELYANGDLPGIATGIDPLDIISGGMRPGELWNILGQTSRGKSVLMLQIAAHAACSGKRVAIFSAEMMEVQVFGRLVSKVGFMKMTPITQPRTAGKGERERMHSTTQRLSDMNFTIDDSPKMTVEHVEAESQRLADANGPLDLITVDYLQFLRVAERIKGEGREREIARISGTLKQLAKAMKCPVLTAAQFNKQNEARESQAIEFDSDCMIGIAEDGLKIMKLRNGQRDEVLPYVLNGEYQRFEKR